MDIYDIPEPVEFDWDEFNTQKILSKHKVTRLECEEIFFCEIIFSQPDILHSGKEERFIIIGRTKNGRHLFLVYTLRKNKVRVISARDMHKKERDLYEKKAKIT